MHVITNKYFKIIVILFFAIITLVACVETTTPRTNASTTTTTLTFQTKALAEGVVGSSYTDNLANATGSDSITYELKSGSSLPEGLSLSSSGLLSGIPLSSVLEYSFTVIASAENTVSAEATFIITIKASLTYSSFTLPEANVNAFYSANLGTATGAEDINYSLQEGSTLPSGLTLSENGILSGSPTETVTNHSFVVLVQSENAVETTATFSINVNPEDTTIIPDTIVYEGITLTTGEVEVAYNADIALATGSDDIVYTLKSGSVLPTGLSLSSVGILTGTPTEPVTDFSFIVVATASNATPAEATFTVTIENAPQTYLFETEYVNVDNMQGGGISGAPATPLDMILSSENASNGYYLGFTHSTGLTIEYDFNSDITTTGKLTLRVGSELGYMLIDTTILQIQVNGVTLSFSSFTIPENSGYSQEFTDFVISDSININEGANVITITVLENTYLNGTTGAPMFDCIYIFTKGDLTWNPKTSNLD